MTTADHIAKKKQILLFQYLTGVVHVTRLNNYINSQFLLDFISMVFLPTSRYLERKYCIVFKNMKDNAIKASRYFMAKIKPIV